MVNTPKKRLRVDEMEVETNSLVNQGANASSNGFLVIQAAPAELLPICQSAISEIEEAEEESEKMAVIDHLATSLRNAISPVVTQGENKYVSTLSNWAIHQGFSEYVAETVTDEETARAAVVQYAAYLGSLLEDPTEGQNAISETSEEETEVVTQAMTPAPKNAADKEDELEDSDEQDEEAEAAAQPKKRAKKAVAKEASKGGEDVKDEDDNETVKQGVSYIPEVKTKTTEIAEDGQTVVQRQVMTPADFLWENLFDIQGATVTQENDSKYVVSGNENEDVEDLTDEEAINITAQALASWDPKNPNKGATADQLANADPAQVAILQQMKELMAQNQALAAKVGELSKARPKSKPRSQQPDGDPTPLVKQEGERSIWQDGVFAPLFAR